MEHDLVDALVVQLPGPGHLGTPPLTFSWPNTLTYKISGPYCIPVTRDGRIPPFFGRIARISYTVYTEYQL